MLDTFAFAASVAECTLETEVSETYQGYRFKATTDRAARPDGARALRLRARADPHRRRRATRTSSTRRGCPASTWRTGWPRSTRADEHIAVADLDTMVEVTLRSSTRRDAARP
jgi:hypothetical protein